MARAAANGRAQPGTGSAVAGREHLTRPRLVAAALAIVDRDGLEGLTMRALGRELSVDPMAAYHWFPNKDAILQGVAEAILAEIPLPPAATTATWQETAMRSSRDYRAALLRHPNALPVASTQPVMTPRGFELIEGIAAAFVAGGLTPGAALEMINTMAALILGSVVAEAGVTPGTQGVTQDSIQEVYSTIDPTQFPTLAAAMVQAGPHMSDDTTQFEVAMDGLIKGMALSFEARGLLASRTAQ
jgi:TetR/AcrR family transcriptional regulator, tetracycline repressor protein